MFVGFVKGTRFLLLDVANGRERVRDRESMVEKLSL